MFRNQDSRHILIFSICLAVVVLALLPHWLRLPTRILVAWNSGTDLFLGMSWWRMIQATPTKMRRYAQRNYEGRTAIFILIIAAACASLLAIGFMLSNKKGLSNSVLTIHLILSGMTIISSWLLVHTIFTIEYAHQYYKNYSDNHDLDENNGGLGFPNCDEPDYWDFLYFSFVIGMTSQVSDIQTTSRSMRRLALIHGVLSFFFNTSILAMTINIIAGLI